MGRLQGRRRSRQGPRDDEQRSGGRSEALRRQDAALVRALGLQVPDGGPEGRRRRDHHPHDAVGRVSLAGRPDLLGGGEVRAAVRGRAARPDQGLGDRGGFAEDRGARRKGPRPAARGGGDGATSGPFRSASGSPSRSRTRSSGKESGNVIAKLPGLGPEAFRRRSFSTRPITTTSGSSRAPARAPTRSTTARSTTRRAWRRCSRSRRPMPRFRRLRAGRSISRRSRRRSRACSGRSTWRSIRRCRRAGSPPTSTSTGSTSSAARAI